LAKVLLEKIPDYEPKALRLFLERAFALSAPERKVKSGHKVLIKPNFLRAKSVSAAVTPHPALIAETCKLLIDLGAKPVIGDSPAMGTANSVAAKIGLDEFLSSSDAAIINLSHPKEVALKNPIKYRKLELSSQVFEFDLVVNLAKLKTHDLLLLTLAVKNLFGCVVGKRKPAYHLEAGHKPELFAELLLEIYKCVSPSISIIDAIIAMEGNGPGNGDPKKLGLLMASEDAVALDRVAGDIVGMPYDYNLTAKLGAKHGVGEGALEKIEIMGPPVDAVKVSDFKAIHPGPPGGQRGVGFGRWLLGENASWKPVFDHQLCTRCSACIDICPSKALSYEPERDRGSKYKKRVKINRDLCIRCFCCQEVCPEGAIRSEKGWLARFLAP
jgi:uncharacterized protein (DUF362 family)/Pyruvate/2-oxoacid:ferredoxin oxidoreductase delta subunit